MILTGTPASTVTFDTGTVHSVFDTSGGGAVNQDPPSGIGTIVEGALDGTVANAWGYKDISDPVLGYYIAGVGTSTDVTGRDAFAYLKELSLAVCSQINKGLGIGISGAFGGVTYSNLFSGDGIDLTLNGGKGDTMANDGTNHINGWPGAAFGCEWQTYYHAVIEQ